MLYLNAKKTLFTLLKLFKLVERWCKLVDCFLHQMQHVAVFKHIYIVLINLTSSLKINVSKFNFSFIKIKDYSMYTTYRLRFYFSLRAETKYNGST